MSQPLNAQVIDREYAHYLPLVHAGKSSISQARIEMNNKGIEPQNIDFAIKQLSRDAERFASKSEAASNAKKGFVISLMVFALGLAITLYTYLVANGVTILAYGAIGTGLSGMAASLAIYNSNKAFMPQAAKKLTDSKILDS